MPTTLPAQTFRIPSCALLRIAHGQWVHTKEKHTTKRQHAKIECDSAQVNGLVGKFVTVRELALR